MSDIPIIGLQGALQPGGARVADVAQAMGATCRQSGFFYVVDHGVPADRIAQQFACARQFFDLPLATKQALSFKQSRALRGYESMGEQTLDAAARPDLKESFYCGLEYADDHPYVRRGLQSYGRNQWPADGPHGVPGMAAQSTAYIVAVQALCVRLMQLMAVSLGLPESYFDHTHANPMITLRLVRYPPHPPHADEHTFGAGAHTDWGAITALAQDDHGGLEVRMPDGRWVAAPPVPGALVINLGDMIPRWTNDHYRSNPHRVRNLHSGGAPRYSIPFFYSPDHDAPVVPVATCVSPERPARYAPCSAGEHLSEMYRKTYQLAPA
jgi:isopenicillin N synthase-like dioxygenase